MTVSSVPSNRKTAGIGLLALSCGMLAAGSYIAQPILSTIASGLGIVEWQAGLAVSASQLGFCLGLLLIVPLGDLLENRRLLLGLVCLQVVALSGVAMATSEIWLLSACLFVGVGSTAVQLLVPLAAATSEIKSRGRAVGAVTAGLLVGVLLARPLASLVAEAVGWRRLFGAQALLVVILGSLLAWRLPAHRNNAELSYLQLLKSLKSLTQRHRPLRIRTTAQACLFAAFSLFWSAIPIVLVRQFHLSPGEIALFALVGAAGALSAPLAGRATDRGLGIQVRRLGAAFVMIGFATTLVPLGITGWIASALLIDAGVQMSHVAAQREILELDDQARSRLNGLYIAGFFLGGAMGSAVSLPLLGIGWTEVAVTAVFLGFAALALSGTSPAANRRTLQCMPQR